jgi:hypothetical protein
VTELIRKKAGAPKKLQDGRSLKFQFSASHFSSFQINENKTVSTVMKTSPVTTEN